MGGFVTDDIRRRAWPLLLGIPHELSDPDFASIKPHAYTDQVEKDVERSLWRFIKSPEKREVKLQELSLLINSILCQNPELHYFQGFHDIASVFLLVSDLDMGYHLTQQVSVSQLRDAFDPTFDAIQSVLHLIFPLIEEFDPVVHQFIMKSEVDPAFALPWILTWFSHHFDNFEKVTRLYDVFLASHPLMHVYLTVASVLHRRSDLLSGPCEYASVHCYLHNLPENVDIDRLVIRAISLMKGFPPNLLLKKAKRAFAPKSAITQYPFPWMKRIGWTGDLPDMPQIGPMLPLSAAASQHPSVSTPTASLRPATTTTSSSSLTSTSLVKPSSSSRSSSLISTYNVFSCALKISWRRPLKIGAFCLMFAVTSWAAWRIFGDSVSDLVGGVKMRGEL